jgi:DNA-binding transcriptional regulator YhcF (GntR family)
MAAPIFPLGDGRCLFSIHSHPAPATICLQAGVPFYRQIIDQIRYGVAAGKLKIGEQLPTVRALAVELKVNLNTVSKAYKELEIQSVLETQQGTGTFIGPQRPNPPRGAA